MPVDPPNKAMLEHYQKRHSRLYRWLRPPRPLIHNDSEQSLPNCEGVKLWVGGAAGTVPVGFLNIDQQPYSGVDVAADVQALPFRDGCVAAIECDAVLEHVRNAPAAVKDLVRVLQPGGYLHVVVPFHQPYHAYPADYQRWTIDGLRELLLLADCEIVAEGIRTGPTATMLSYVCEYCRILVPAPLGKAAYAAAGWILWPLRYLDLWLNRKPNAHVLANAIYILARKSETASPA
jgi:SAM-dependent methyltransferase